MYNLDLEVWMLVEDLLYSAVIAALLWLNFRSGQSLIFKLFVAEIGRSGDEVGRLFGRGVA